MARKSFSYLEVLGFGWRVMKSNFWFFVGVWVVSFFLPYFVSFFVYLPGQILVKVMGHFSERLNLAIFGLLSVVVVFITIIINVILGIGITKITLSFCDNQKPRFSTLFKAWGCFWRYIGAGLLYGLIIGGTATLFIVTLTLLSRLYDVLRNPFFVIPFFIMLFILLVALSIKFSLCCYFVVDKGVGPIRALKASSRATERAKLSLFVFFILCGLINLLGTLCFIVGLFATVPMVIVAMALVYRQLSNQTPALAEIGIGCPSVHPSARGDVGSSTQAFVGMQPNPIIPSIQSIQSGPGTHPGLGVQPAPGIRREGEKKSRNSLPWWVVVLSVCVAIAAGISYYFLVMVKGSSPNKVATSLKNAAVSLKDAAISSNKVALKGILYSEDNSSAMVGNKIVKEGDIIDGVKVVKINKDTVEFEKDGQRWTQQTK